MTEMLYLPENEMTPSTAFTFKGKYVECDEFCKVRMILQMVNWGKLFILCMWVYMVVKRVETAVC